MLKHAKMLLALFILASIALFISCQEQQSIPTANDQTDLKRLAQFSLPAGETLVSATLFVYEEVWDNYHQINVHKVTSNWEEASVTWNTRPSFDATIINTFNSYPDAGWREVEITFLVQDWINNGSNYGLLLDAATTLYGFARFNSREAIANQPYLQLTTSAGTITLNPIADASVWENEPNNAKGQSVLLTVGKPGNGFTKQSLIQFELIPPPVVECETAYAFGNIEFCGLPGIQSNNWGWSREITGNVNLTNIPIYAGAAQCDPNNGMQVGTLSISFDGTALNVDYDIDENVYTVEKVHMWIGDTYLPLNAKGKYKAAPGQYNHNNETFPFSTTDYDATFYIAVHFDVCWEVTQ